MNLRPANLNALACRRRNSEDMKPVPKADPEVIAHLKAKYPKHLVHIASAYDDRARLEHSYWCHAGDWHVSYYYYYVDDDTKKVYIVIDI